MRIEIPTTNQDEEDVRYTLISALRCFRDASRFNILDERKGRAYNALPSELEKRYIKHYKNADLILQVLYGNTDSKV